MAFYSEKEFNCHRCTEGQKKGKGCTIPAESPYILDALGRLVFSKNALRMTQPFSDAKKCPKKMITQQTDYYIFLYGEYDNGHYLFSGGVMDQPGKYLSLMRSIKSEIANLNSLKE